MNRLEHFAQYLQTHPTDRLAMYGLALELSKAQRLDDAAQAFESLLDAHPHSGAGHYQHGMMWADAGELEKAEEAWNRGLKALDGLDTADARRSRSEIQLAMDVEL